MADKIASPVIISSDPIRIDLHMTASNTYQALDFLRRVRGFAQEMTDYGLDVQLEGYINITVTSSATPPEETVP